LSRRRTLAAALAAAGLALPLHPLSVAEAGPGRPSLGERDLRQGMEGRDVRVLQDFLTRVGLQTGVDGQYGPATARRVKSWERRSRRRVDGRMSRQDSRRLRGQVEAGITVRETRDPSEPGTGEAAVLHADGTATAPESAPEAVKAVIEAGNRIVGKPYKYGGGHGRWEDSGYDCSGSMSYALHGAGLLDRALTSGGFSSYGRRGEGEWITVYGSGEHSYMVVAGLRFDTGWNDRSSDGPDWSERMRPGDGYTVRHPAGL
jgi:hypothetical protein